MIDVLISQPLAKAIGARREAQRNLDRLTLKIAARASRKATIVWALNRARHRAGRRLYHHQFFDRLSFEEWSELDTITCKLAMQEQVIGELQVHDYEPVRDQAI